MTTEMSRRQLLGRSSALGVGIVLAGSIEAIAGPGSALAAASSGQGYGALVPDPAGLLSLPRGFHYTVVARAGETTLEDVVGPAAAMTPSDADGTAAFPRVGGSTLVNNHEIGSNEPYGVPPLAGLTYDPAARGGTTSIEVDKHGNRLREYVSVAGTHNNCAGGITPWGTWLTCEETEDKAGQLVNGVALTKNHGYVFEVDPESQTANLDKSPVPLKFLGRYAHEAVAVDPNTLAIYLTEDAGSPLGLYFRWNPPAGFTGGKGALRRLAESTGGATAGSLQAMRCSAAGVHITDLSQATAVGTTYDVSWVDVPDRDGTTTSVRKQLTNAQVTRSRKLEGQWWGDGGIYFVASFARSGVGGDGSINTHDGQVWFLDPAAGTITLKTIFGKNPDPSVEGGFDGPDNISVSPYGGVILAEDGEGLSHLVGVTEDGKAYALARNELNDSEFTGPTFSADGKVLFACIQTPGIVLAITGPWKRNGSPG
jgi:secreted PhoX family phosphatase